MDEQQRFADAMRAFDAYYGARRASYGMDWPARRYVEHRAWPTFVKVAKTCAKNGWDVERYVTTVVQHLRKPSDQVVPGDLTSKAAMAIWAEHRGDRPIGAADKWAYYARQLMAIQRATGLSDEAILASAMNAQFPAWFRVMYPEHVGDALVGAWGEDAVEELREDRDVVRFLRAAFASKMETFERKVGVIDGL